ncbi:MULTISPECIES: hypothetical protein [Micrococcales]|uniref:hypothetical protein n=1 Tax=Micrococcales TaxID=85006 RepID=UPI0004AB07F3|nr:MULTISPECIES: hypothetical protein [Micrococcales]
MKPSQLGLIVGLALGAIAFFGGFLAFLVAVVFAAIGAAVGLLLEGKLDLRSLMGRGSDRR